VTPTMPSLLDLMHAPAIKRPVQPDGHVLAGAPDETLRWQPDPRKLYLHAEIELHRHTDGNWMWSTTCSAGLGGWGYKVGPKWGHFAMSRADALHHARCELIDRLGARNYGDTTRIIGWAQSLT
jgi:hypothetical protein